eukprot:5172386-Ditylum_brightwellii.AAC.1
MDHQMYNPQGSHSSAIGEHNSPAHLNHKFHWLHPYQQRTQSWQHGGKVYMCLLDYAGLFVVLRLNT